MPILYKVYKIPKQTVLNDVFLFSDNFLNEELRIEMFCLYTAMMN